MLEGPDPVPRPPPPRDRLRPARQRPRPAGRVDPTAYAEAAFADDALAVLDATGTDRAVVVGLSLGAQRGLILATRHPERVAGMVLIGPAVALAPLPPERARAFEHFHDERDDGEPWAKHNAHYWRRDFPGFLEFFFSQAFSEPHSTKQIEDCVGWGLECGRRLPPGVGGRGRASAT